MALSTDKLKTIQGYHDELAELCSNNADTGMRDHLNTFNYVYRHLESWADEATVGSTMRDNIAKINEGVAALVEKTDILNDKIAQFVDIQTQINSGGQN